MEHYAYPDLHYSHYGTMATTYLCAEYLIMMGDKEHVITNKPLSSLSLSLSLHPLHPGTGAGLLGIYQHVVEVSQKRNRDVMTCTVLAFSCSTVVGAEMTCIFAHQHSRVLRATHFPTFQDHFLRADTGSGRVPASPEDIKKGVMLRIHHYDILITDRVIIVLTVLLVQMCSDCSSFGFFRGCIKWNGRDTVDVRHIKLRYGTLMHSGYRAVGISVQHHEIIDK
ncbi:hypothetical protein C8J57DRAFT_1244162 [Mycena rebaudengoi]|nr:hypothetical protein C8J57DRAFT_1244162 [Mycena rebaudengoi]